MELEDLTSNGQYVHQWTLVDGEPRCVEDAIPATDPGALTALQRNAAVRSILADIVALPEDGDPVPILASLDERATLPLSVDPRPVPASVALWQFKAALASRGMLEQANALVEAENDAVLSAYWETGGNVLRSSPMLAKFAFALGASDGEVDDLLRQAAVLSL